LETVSACEAGPQQLQLWEAIGKRWGGAVIMGKLLRVGGMRGCYSSAYTPLGYMLKGGDAVLQYIPPWGIFSRDGGHTPAGGQIQISLHRQEASTALIHVANDGEGIPPGQLRHIFGRFYRECRPQSGQRRGRYRSDHLQGIE
jgi:Osmosensitive K+ channel histidine kinase